MSSRSISIVVPVYSEQDSLGALVDEIRGMASEHGLAIEIVFVDDGSTDESWSRIRGLAEADGSVGGVRFRRNAGKAAALMAGFAAARGEVVVTMDADLQDPPQEVPRLLAKLDEGFDVVSGWKKVRHDPWHKVYPSRVFNRLIGFLTGVHLHDHVCGLKAYRREVLGDLRIHGELHRFLAVFASAKGWRVTEIATLHRARTQGVGKYGFTRFFKGFLDLLTVCVLTRYRWRPQHVIGMAGLAVILLSFLMVLGAMVVPIPARFLPLICGLPLISVPALLTAAMVVLIPGVTLIAIGLVGELIVADRPADDLYKVVDRVGWCAEPA